MMIFTSSVIPEPLCRATFKKTYYDNGQKLYHSLLSTLRRTLYTFSTSHLRIPQFYLYLFRFFSLKRSLSFTRLHTIPIAQVFSFFLFPAFEGQINALFFKGTPYRFIFYTVFTIFYMKISIWRECANKNKLNRRGRGMKIGVIGEGEEWK